MSNEDDRGLVYKVTVVGDGTVGKTSLIRKFTQGEFSEKYIMTMGAQFTQYETSIAGNPVKLVFWDIAGQEAFGQLRANFYQGSSAAIIVFSHEENDHGEKSFQNISKWLNDIKKNCGMQPIILFGNKIDLIENIDKLVMNKEYPKSNYNVDILMKGYNFLGYYLTSALTGQGVNQAFGVLANKLFQIYKNFA
ncbi:MAG: GTP-binding protein [Promethearchaeota archaeon]|nr:MAG: GTP-binding protein [Candidatus Lokiarchaeota archaeon]